MSSSSSSSSSSSAAVEEARPGAAAAGPSSLDVYYGAKLDALEAALREKAIGLLRLQAQRNALNTKGGCGRASAARAADWPYTDRSMHPPCPPHA